MRDCRAFFGRYQCALAQCASACNTSNETHPQKKHFATPEEAIKNLYFIFSRCVRYFLKVAPMLFSLMIGFRNTFLWSQDQNLPLFTDNAAFHIKKGIREISGKQGHNVLYYHPILRISIQSNRSLQTSKKLGLLTITSQRLMISPSHMEIILNSISSL